MFFCKICDGEFNKKHIGVTLFSLQLCVHEYMLIILCEKGTKLFQDAGGYFLKFSGRSGKVLISRENL